MFVRFSLALPLLAATVACGQGVMPRYSSPAGSATATGDAWKRPADMAHSEPREEGTAAEVRNVANERGPLAAAGRLVEGVRKQIAQVKNGTPHLPSDAGQVWR